MSTHKPVRIPWCYLLVCVFLFPMWAGKVSEMFNLSACVRVCVYTLIRVFLLKGVNVTSCAEQMFPTACLCRPNSGAVQVFGCRKDQSHDQDGLFFGLFFAFNCCSGTGMHNQEIYPSPPSPPLFGLSFYSHFHYVTVYAANLPCTYLPTFLSLPYLSPSPCLCPSNSQTNRLLKTIPSPS